MRVATRTGGLAAGRIAFSESSEHKASRLVALSYQLTPSRRLESTLHGRSAIIATLDLHVRAAKKKTNLSFHASRLVPGARQAKTELTGEGRRVLQW